MPHCAISTSHAFGPVLVCFLAVILSALPRSAGGSNPTGWLATDYPDPRAEQPSGACGFASGESAAVTPATSPINATTWVCDPDRVLSPDEAISLANSLGSLTHKSPCDCQTVECPGSDVSPTGYLIGIALVDRLNTDGMKFEPINVKAANFAKATREKWFSGLGCDDNALVFYSRFSNELYISIGEETKGVVSDLELAGLYRLGDSYFAAADDDEDDAGQTTPASSAAIYDGLDAVLRELDAAILNGPSISSDVIFAFTIPVLLVVLLTAMCLLSNICCAQDIALPEPAHQGRSTGPSEADDKAEDEAEDDR